MEGYYIYSDAQKNELANHSFRGQCMLQLVGEERDDAYSIDTPSDFLANVLIPLCLFLICLSRENVFSLVVFRRRCR